MIKLAVEPGNKLYVAWLACVLIQGLIVLNFFFSQLRELLSDNLGDDELLEVTPTYLCAWFLCGY